MIRRLLTGDPLRKRHANDILKPLIGEHSVIVLEPPEHLERRRLLLPPFHGERIEIYARLMRELTAADLAEWPEDGVVTVHPRARSLALQVILQAVFGTRDQRLASELEAVYDNLASPFAGLGIFMPQFAKRARWNVIAERFYKLKDRLDRLFTAHVAATRGDPRLAERNDILAMLVLARDEDGNGLSDLELRDELATLVAAGHETTAAATAWGAELLARNPQVADRLRSEVAGGDREYLSATVKEVLRIRTVVPVSAGRYSLDPLPAGEWMIPPEVAFLVDAHSIHHDPGIHPDPEAFRPERFLEGSPEPYTYLPFGGGAHRCLGASLASLEMEIVLGAIVEQFDLAAAGPPERAARRGVSLVPARGARVRVRRR